MLLVVYAVIMGCPMNETDFTRETMRSLQALAGNFYYHKIADAGSQEYSHGRAIDVVCSWGGHFIGIEFKLHKKPTCAFALSSVRDYQIEQLVALHNTKATALLMIGVIEGPRKQCLYSIPIDIWLARTASLQRKSVSLSAVFPDYGIDLPATKSKWLPTDLISILGRHQYHCRFYDEKTD